MGRRSLCWTRLAEALIARRWLLVVLIGELALACAGSPYVLEGDANSVGVAYGGDMESATAVAKRHCAPFERVPKFHEIEQDVAYFYCVRP